MQEILSPDIVHASSLVNEDVTVTHMWMDKVLNKLTNYHLKNILKRSKAHAEIHVRRQEVTLYGVEADREALREELTKYFSIALKTMFREVDITKRSGGQRGQAMRALIRQYGPHLVRLRNSTGVDAITVDLKRGVLFIDGSEESYESLVCEIDEILKDVAKTSDSNGHNEVVIDECAACFCPPVEAHSKPYRLAACGHFFCLACLKDHVKECGSSKRFPITCPGCEESIMLCDIKTIYPNEDERQELYSAGLDAYVAGNVDGDIKFCPGPDCCMVFKFKTDGGSVNCEECGFQYCSGCGEKPHPYDMTCKEFQITQEETEDDVEQWMKATGADVKKCPVCKAVIEKNRGCNHMTCKMCKKHLCWRCLKVFDTEQECYSHLAKSCGGIFGEDVQRVAVAALEAPQPRRRLDLFMRRHLNGVDDVEFEDDALHQLDDEARALRQRAEAGVTRARQQREEILRRQGERQREMEVIRQQQREAEAARQAERQREAETMMRRYREVAAARREREARDIRERQERQEEIRRQAERQREMEAIRQQQREAEAERQAERQREVETMRRRHRQEAARLEREREAEAAFERRRLAVERQQRELEAIRQRRRQVEERQLQEVEARAERQRRDDRGNTFTRLFRRDKTAEPKKKNKCSIM